MMTTMKTSTLLTATKKPGRCASCRHANQSTVDFAGGDVFCAIDDIRRRPDTPCDRTVSLPTRSGGPLTSGYWLYEAYDGTNGTYGVLADLRLLAEDADDDLRRALNLAERSSPY